MESLRHWRYIGLEHKACYQRNQFWSLGTVCVLALAVLTLLVLWPQDDMTTLTIPVGSTIKPNLVPSRLTHVPPAARSTGGSGGLASVPRGLGHNSHTINIIRDEVSVVDNDNVLAITRPRPIDDARPISFADDWGSAAEEFIPFSDGAGGSDLLGLGDNTFGLPNGIYCPADIRWSGDELSGHDTALTTPVYLGLAVPAFPPAAQPEDTGIVVVDITVDKGGYVSFKIQSVTPSARGFGLAVEWAILNGEYRPRVVKGVAVDHSTRVTLVMVRNEEPSVMGQTAEFTHSTHDVAPVWLYKR